MEVAPPVAAQAVEGAPAAPPVKETVEPVAAAPVETSPAPTPVVEAAAPVVEAAPAEVKAVAPVVEAPKPVAEAPKPVAEAPKAVAEAPKAPKAPVAKTGGKPAGKPAGKPPGRSADRPAGKPAGKPAGRPAGRPANRPLGRTSTRPLGRNVGRTAERSAREQAAKLSDARAEGERRRQARTVPTRPRLPGLGPAVIKPPPGWDPNNPNAHRKKPAAAATASKTAAKPEAKSGWTGPTPAGAGERRRPGTTDTRPDNRRGRRTSRGRRQAQFVDNLRSPRRKRKSKRAGPKQEATRPKAEAKRRIQVDNTISVRQLSIDLGIKANQIMKTLMSLGTTNITINDQLDLDTASLVAGEFDYEVVNVGFQEESHFIQTETEEEEEGVKRPPVVTIMGHVDHGKTTLLDSIRRANVAEKEAGGITQHISAYQVDRNGELVTFIDTPGHQAFTEMRARGANSTDIVILVVAADDGIMPQTVESINHARAAGVPIVVAINKCDKPGVNPDTIRQRLMEHELVPEEYGGDTLMVNVSALKAENLEELLDAVLLVAELQEYTANEDRHAEGVVLEAQIEKGRGPVATVLVQNGTLKQGDHIVLGSVCGKVRAMTDYRGKRSKKASPSSPVEIIGLQGVPLAGDNFVVVGSDKDAKALAEHRAAALRKASMQTTTKTTLQDLFAKAKEGEIRRLNLVVKGDVQGSVEALKGSLKSIQVEGCEVQILHSAVGAVSESDVTMADAYSAIILGFNVRPDAKARRAAESNGIEIRTYRVIYELLDDVKKALVGLLEPTLVERHQGTAQIREVFVIPKIGAIAGCFITDGNVARNHQARLLRDGTIVWEGKLASLKRFKNDVREVANGYECGMSLDGYQDIKKGDEIETFIIEAVEATI